MMTQQKKTFLFESEVTKVTAGQKQIFDIFF